MVALIPSWQSPATKTAEQGHWANKGRQSRTFGKAAVVALVVATMGFVSNLKAQPTSNYYTTFDAVPGRRIQIGAYGSAHRDCSRAPLPVVRVIEPPKFGTLIVRKGSATINKVKDCPDLSIRVQVALYRARVGSIGADHLIYEVDSANGEKGLYDVTLSIKESPEGSPASKK